MTDLSRLPMRDVAAAGCRSAVAAQILALGDLRLWRSACGGIPAYRELRFMSFADFGPEVLAESQPDLIVSPVVAPSFDCLDVAFLLEAARFRGAYRAMSRNMPRPEIIRREVRSCCPTLDFDIIAIGPDGLRKT